MQKAINNFLNRFSIVQINIVSLFVFSLTVIVLATFSLNQAWQDLTYSKDDKQLLDLLDALEKVVHHHAVERGLTAGFLGDPTDQAKAKLNE